MTYRKSLDPQTPYEDNSINDTPEPSLSNQPEITIKNKKTKKKIRPKKQSQTRTATSRETPYACKPDAENLAVTR